MNYRFPTFFVLIFSIFFSTTLLAQLTDWSSKTTLIIENTDSTARTDFSHLIYFDSATPIANGEMATDGSDIRVALDCEGTTIVPHYLESGIGTSTTKLWVLIPSIPARGSDTIFIFHGNRNATDTSDFDATFPNQLILSTTDTIAGLILDSVWEYNYIRIDTGVIVKFSPANALPWKMRIHAGKIDIAGTLNGTGMGYDGVVAGDGDGPGGGGVQTTGGGGGGYGGDGGEGSYGSAQTSAGESGPKYGTTDQRDISAGSGGGAAGAVGGGNPGGAGGIMFDISAYEVHISGSLLANGNDGFSTTVSYSSGGGSGGGIKIKAHNFSGTGTLSVKGGNGGNSDVIYYAGGGGGGGRIKVFHSNTNTFTGTTNIKGGFRGFGGITDAEPGDDGTLHSEATSNEMSRTIVVPKPILAAPSGPFCRNSDILITAPAIGSNYNFFVNGTSAQTGASNTFTFNSGFPINTIFVDITIGTCVERTNSIAINLLDSPEPLISTVGSFTGFCPGDSVQLSVDNTDNNNFKWIKDGTPILVGSELSPFFKEPGSYTIADTNSAGCVGTSEAITISEFKAPTTELDLTTNTFCGGDSLLVKIINLGDSTAQWSETGSVFSEKDSVYIKTEGVFSVQLISPEGCIGNSVAFSTTITDTPTLTIESEFGLFVCPAKAAKLNKTGAASSNSFQWFKDDLALTAELAISIETSDPGTYYLAETNSIGCTGNSNSISIQNFGPFSVQTPSSLEFCEGSEVVFEIDLNPDLTYNWFLDGNPHATTRPDSVSFSSSGTVHLEIENGFGCVDQSSDFAITETPIPTGTILFPNGNAFCPGESLEISTDYTGNVSWLKDGVDIGITSTALNITEAGDYSAVLEPNSLCEGVTNILTITERDVPMAGTIAQSNDSLFANETATSYQWFLDGSAVQNATGQFITDLVFGSYTVQLFNEFNCGSPVSGAYAYDPNGLFELGQKSQFFIFPNPSTGLVKISGDVTRITVYNSNGQELISKRKANNLEDLEITIENHGIYFVQVSLEDGAVKYKKVVIH